MVISNDHNVFVVASITVRQSLISDFDLGKIQTTSFCARSASSGHANGEKCTEKGAIDFPSSKAGTQTPNMLKWGFTHRARKVCNMYIKSMPSHYKPEKPDRQSWWRNRRPGRGQIRWWAECNNNFSFPWSICKNNSRRTVYSWYLRVLQ